MSDNKSQLATFRIEPELWDSFKSQARKSGKTASDVLIELVQGYVEGASTELPRLDNLDERIDERVVEAIAPLKAELDELRAQLGECVA